MNNFSTSTGLSKGFGDSLYQPLDATLTALAAYNTNGLLTQTAANTFAGRTITGTPNQVNVDNGNGVEGNPTLSLPQNIHISAKPAFAAITLIESDSLTTMLTFVNTAEFFAASLIYGDVTRAASSAYNFIDMQANDVPQFVVRGDGQVTTTGSVGIGTSTPSTKLHATTDDSATATVTDILQLNHSSSGTPAASFGTGLLFTGESTTTDARNMARIQSIWSTATDASRASKLQFQTLTGAGSLTTQVTIDGSGNLGIGTTGPAAKLDVNSGSSGGGISLTGSDASATPVTFANTAASFANSLIYGPVTRAASSAYNFIDMRANSVQQFVVRGDGQVTTTGNVGVKAASPAVALDFGSASVNAGQIINLYTASNVRMGFGMDASTASMRMYVAGASTEFFSWGSISTGDGSTYTEKMRLTQPGSLVIGTAAIATNATDGFIYMPSCAGVPSGTPTTFTGRVPTVIDTTNSKLCAYIGGAWKSVTLS